jgi:CheY-like chemotaxis protein
VIEAENGAIAVEKAVEASPDLILMDLAMPVMGGKEAVQKLREIDGHRRTPIICITAYGDQYAQRAHGAGCGYVIAKPIDFRQLDPLVASYTHNPSDRPPVSPQACGRSPIRRLKPLRDRQVQVGVLDQERAF